MNKEERIARYGEEAYERKLERERARYKAHPEEVIACAKRYKEQHPEEVKAKRSAYYEAHKEEIIVCVKKYREENPEKIKANHQEDHRKGGRRYAKHLKDNRTGLRGDRNKIRLKHRNQYRPFKNIIAPDSQLHHEWVPKTAEYKGVALVEANAHQYGIVDVIQILEGKITLLTEEEVKREKKREKKGL